jgi:hypothetical protein
VKKIISTGKEDVHPQNGLNELILNWCIGGCYFTPTNPFATNKVPSKLHFKATSYIT